MYIHLKKYQSTLIFLSILVIPLGVQSGEVTSTFSPGGTLTSTQMTEIKDAVNDNDSRSIANEGDVFSNTAAIGNLFGGDGSAGDLTISASVDWDSAPPANPMFNNITIDAGQTLTVPAGTTIRCSGTFTNNGTLNVLPGAETDGAFSIAESFANAPTWGLTSVAHPGDTPRAATLGEYSNTAVTVTGGQPGGAIPQAVATTSYANFRIGGGSGAGYDNQGARGGGLVKIYCTGAIVNAGSILANGQDASNTTIAGGGGGIVILASRTSVDNSAGTISVNGGSSNNGTGSWGGNSGGGGGGIVIMASPVAPVLGIELVAGGTGGTDTSTASTTTARTGGAGGGGSGGAGGRGGSVQSAGAKNNGIDGSDGYTLTFTYDPIFITR